MGPLSPEILQGIQADIKHLLLFGYNAFFFFFFPLFSCDLKKKNYTIQGPFPGPPEARAPILRIGCTGLCTALSMSGQPD